MKKRSALKIVLLSSVISVVIFTIGYYGISIYKLSKYTTGDMIQLIAGGNEKHSELFTPPYAFEAHLYLCRGGQEDVELIRKYGGLTLFLTQQSAHYTPAVRKRIVEFYLNKGIDINERMHDGRTILHFAAATNQSNVVQWLLQSGADPSIKDNPDTDSPGMTPLELVRDKKNIFGRDLEEQGYKGTFDETIKVLENHIAKIDE